MASGRWAFKQVQRTDVMSDPTVEAFYNTGAIDSKAEALIREAIQNTLDASVGGGPVVCRIALCRGATALGSTEAAPFVKGLAPHLDSQREMLTGLADLGKPMSFLRYEDFGTRGLGGNPEEFRDVAGSRNDFFYFWRNVGRGKKEGGDGGRWGIGKTVFPAASGIHSFFGLTVRADGRRLLMGQSVLRIHSLPDHAEEFYPYGYFGNFADEDQFATPLEDEATLRQFGESFGLTRTNETGLSVIVPYPHDSFTEDALLVAVVRHYFYPLLTGELVVELTRAGSVLCLDRAWLDEMDAFLKAPENRGLVEALTAVRGQIDLARWAIALPDAERIQTMVVGGDKAPKWAAELLPGTSLKDIASRLDRGDRVAVRVPVVVKASNSTTAHTSQFDIYLQRDATISKSDEMFVRAGITISGMKTLTGRGVRGLVVVPREAKSANGASPVGLAALLGDAENPAHTEWQEKSSKFEGKYKHGVSTLRFVKGSLRDLLQLADSTATETDTRSLRHMFFIDKPPTAGDPTKTKKPKPQESTTETDAPEVDVPDPSPRHFKIERIDDGFRVFGSAAASELPEAIEVRVAYDVRKGNAFMKYRPHDFRLDKSPIEMTSNDVRVIERAGNRLVFAPMVAGFDVRVLGFGTNRDILVEARAVEDNDAEED